MFAKSLGSILQEKDGKTVLDENGQPLLEPSGGSSKSLEQKFITIQPYQLKNASSISKLKTQKLVNMNRSTLLKIIT